MPNSPLTPDGPLGWFANELFSVEVPDLPAGRRDEVVRFVCRRTTGVPSPLRLGLVLIVSGVGAARWFADDITLASFLRSTELPFVGELARLVRSLGFAYVWETWPDTSPTGSPGGREVR